MSHKLRLEKVKFEQDNSAWKYLKSELEMKRLISIYLDATRNVQVISPTEIFLRANRLPKC